MQDFGMTPERDRTWTGIRERRIKVQFMRMLMLFGQDEVKEEDMAK